MTNFEHLKNMSIAELAEWLDVHGQFDTSPWQEWFSQVYCNKCEPIKCKYADAEERFGFTLLYSREIECSYCELEGRCKFFPDLDDIPSNIETIKMWLNKETE